MPRTVTLHSGLAVRASGPDVGWPAVVLLPGLGASSMGWSRIHQLLAERTRVVSYDRAGLGASPPVDGDRGVDPLAAELAHVIRVHSGPGPAALVGHSLGATLARYVATTRPDLVAGLVLIDPIPDRWVLRYGWGADPTGRMIYRALETLAHLNLIDAVLALPGLRNVTRSSTSPLAAFTDVQREALAAEMRNPGSHRTSRRELTGLLHSRTALRALATNPGTGSPLIVLSGTHTRRLAAPLRRAANTWHTRLVAASPQARHLVIDDGGHLIPRYQPEVVVAAVVDLLGGIRPAIAAARHG
jgi:pimeloyl-ACP methyl ester carboxylesterase